MSTERTRASSERPGSAIKAVDPFASAGRWLITTGSGAVHLIDSRDLDEPVTVTRITIDAIAAEPGTKLAGLRRDSQSVRVLSVTHLDSAGALLAGIAVGADMYLRLEPLGSAATFTLRRTTPVRTITAMPEDADAPAHEGDSRV